jgi:hypothetical protein
MGTGDFKSCTNPLTRQGFKPLANSSSPLKWTQILGRTYLVHLSGLELLAVELIPRRILLPIIRYKFSGAER